jgi:hypothetical protein
LTGFRIKRDAQENYPDCWLDGAERKHMTQQDISQAKNADLRGSLAALQRAAAEARRIAIQTNTGIVIMRDGQRGHLSAEALRRQAHERTTA